MTIDKDEKIKNLTVSAGAMGFAALSMQDFSTKILKHVFEGRPLDDVALKQIRESCITDLKNSETRGLHIQIEAASFRKAIETLEQLIDGAIDRARKI
jgi:hypothetical protein